MANKSVPQYRVSADIRYQEGLLINLPLPLRHVVHFPTFDLAHKHLLFLHRVHMARDFIRAAHTGNKFAVTGNLNIERVQS